MELVFDNAMKWNKNKKDNKEWYNEAKRLSQILSTLRAKKPLHNFKWIPYDKQCRYCPNCNNILKPIESIQKRQCNGSCNGNKINFICYNHKDNVHSFCRRCIKKHCRVGNNRISNDNSNNKIYDSPKKCSQVPPNPQTVEKYERHNVKDNNISKRSNIKPIINWERNTEDKRSLLNQQTVVKQNIHNFATQVIHDEHSFNQNNNNNVAPSQKMVHNNNITTDSNIIDLPHSPERRVNVNDINNKNNSENNADDDDEKNMLDITGNVQNLTENNDANTDPERREAFEMLGLKPNATQSQIDKAFRNLARQNHPDKIHKILEERMRKINRAHEICKMRTQRQQSDDQNYGNVIQSQSMINNNKYAALSYPKSRKPIKHKNVNIVQPSNEVLGLSNQNPQTFEREHISSQMRLFPPISFINKTSNRNQTIIRQNIRQQVACPVTNNGIEENASGIGQRESDDKEEGEGKKTQLLMVIVIIAFIIEMLFTV